MVGRIHTVSCLVAQKLCCCLVRRLNCCEILKYSQVYEPYWSIVGQERGRTHRDLYERRKIKSNLNQTNPNLV